MRARTNRRAQKNGNGGDQVAILSNNCNNIVIAILAKAKGIQTCKTNS